MIYVALSLSVAALMLSLWSAREKLAGLWGRKPPEPYLPPCEPSPMRWQEKTAPPTDPNYEVIAGLQEWPEWSVEVEKRWKRPEERLPGDPSFRIRS